MEYIWWCASLVGYHWCASLVGYHLHVYIYILFLYIYHQIDKSIARRPAGIGKWARSARVRGHFAGGSTRRCLEPARTDGKIMGVANVYSLEFHAYLNCYIMHMYTCIYIYIMYR